MTNMVSRECLETMLVRLGVKTCSACSLVEGNEVRRTVGRGEASLFPDFHFTEMTNLQHAFTTKQVAELDLVRPPP